MDFSYLSTKRHAVMFLNLARRQHTWIDSHFVQPTCQEAFQAIRAQSQRRRSRTRVNLPLGIREERAGRRRPKTMLAVLVNMHTRLAVRGGAPWLVTGHDVYPFARSQLILKIGSRAEPAFRVEQIRRDAIRTIRRGTTVKAQRPLVRVGLPFAKPINIGVRGFPRESQRLRAQPRLDRQPL